MLLDVHTHHLPSDSSSALLSCFMHDCPLPEKAKYLAAGIHPWYITQKNYQKQLTWVESMLTDRRVIALGETGLDKHCSTPFELQTEVFRHMISLADKHYLPLFIHAVKSTEELIALKKELRPRNPWIIHGFRGKKELAQSLIRQGCYLSFGEKYNSDSLLVTPIEKLLLETDESSVSIEELYSRVALQKSISPDALITNIQETVSSLFFSR